jgi:hypothetical protein
MNKGKNMRNISQDMHLLIQKHCIIGYDPEDERLPSSICGSCRLIIQQHEKGNLSSQIPIYDYCDIGRLPRTRSETEEGCICKVCQIARTNIGSGVVGVSKRPAGRPSNKPQPLAQPSVLQLCSSCLSVVGPGKSHNCSKVSRMVNIHTLAAGSSPKAPEKLSAMILKSKAHESGEAQLSTHVGRPINVLISPQSTTSKKFFTADDISKIQQDLNLSTRETHRLGQDVRTVMKSRLSVEPKLKKKLFEKDHRLDCFFEVKLQKYVKIEKNIVTDHVERSTVSCTDVDGLLQKIIEMRNLRKDDLLIKIGIDGGGGFIKICLTMFSSDPLSEYGTNSRSSYDAGVAAKKLKYSGVKKLIILAIVPSVQENYENMQKLWVNLGLDRLEKEFTIATDMKLCNILLGIMAHGSSHPCCWCNVHMNCLVERGVDRTFQTLQNSFLAYCSSGSDRIKAKNYDNVVHPSIVNGQNEKSVLELIPPPELHLLIGPVNTMYFGLKKVWTDCDKWLKKCNVQQEAMHGGSFNGNNCRTLLKKIDDLQAMCPIQCLPYVAAFRSFSKVVSSCYSNDLNPDFENHILDFKNKYLDLDISVTPKIHAVFSTSQISAA